MTVVAPLDIETQHDGIIASDGIVILDNPVVAPVAPVEVAAHRDPAMILVYVGLLTLITITILAAVLAL